MHCLFLYYFEILLIFYDFFFPGACRFIMGVHSVCVEHGNLVIHLEH